MPAKPSRFDLLVVLQLRFLEFRLLEDFGGFPGCFGFLPCFDFPGFR